MTVHHGAMDVRYGLLIRHEDGSWHPYGSMTGMSREHVDALLEHPPYGLSLDHFRTVRWTALALCGASGCKGHNDPDWQCPKPLVNVAPSPMLGDGPDDSDGPVIYVAC